MRISQLAARGGPRRTAHLAQASMATVASMVMGM